jgi:hypothetical protein
VGSRQPGNRTGGFASPSKRIVQKRKAAPCERPEVIRFEMPSRMASHRHRLFLGSQSPRPENFSWRRIDRRGASAPRFCDGADGDWVGGGVGCSQTCSQTRLDETKEGGTRKYRPSYLCRFGGPNCNSLIPNEMQISEFQVRCLKPLRSGNSTLSKSPVANCSILNGAEILASLVLHSKAANSAQLCAS